MRTIRILQSALIIAIIAIAVCLTSCDDNDDKVIAPGIGDYDLNEATLRTEGYTKVFEDNFNTSLDLWDIWTGGAYNNELQYYQASNLVVTDGILAIKAKKETVEGQSVPGSGEMKTFGYTSGRIESNFEITPTVAAGQVRISARIKLPEGYGMWPAFWSYSEPWPTHGEIDIMEALGNSDTDSYHVYEVIWSKDSLVFILDGVIVDTKLASSPGNNYISEFFGKPEHIVLNAAIGGDIFPNFDAGKIKTADMYVDWVKIFTKP